MDCRRLPKRSRGSPSTDQRTVNLPQWRLASSGRHWGPMQHVLFDGRLPVFTAVLWRTGRAGRPNGRLPATAGCASNPGRLRSVAPGRRRQDVASPPAAQPCVGLTKLRASRGSASASLGTSCLVQVAPPSVVRMMVEPRYLAGRSVKGSTRPSPSLIAQPCVGVAEDHVGQVHEVVRRPELLPDPRPGLAAVCRVPDRRAVNRRSPPRRRSRHWCRRRWSAWRRLRMPPALGL